VRVEAQKVCMINDHFMAAPQIPVSVEGKTYYGCCPMCEQRLRTQPDSRFGIDPVSKKRVDKASAVIGKLESGSVLYFENEQTFNAYPQRS
jgi:YHS domain-containing protein